MKIKLSPPWIQYVNKVKTMFERDDDIQIEYNDDAKKLTLNVRRYEKAKALKKIMPNEITFANVDLQIDIEYKEYELPLVDYYQIAFEDNPVFKYTYCFSDGAINYVVFEKEVAQFWNDDMSDPHGVTSMLYQDIAKDIFGNKERILFSTDSEKDNGWINKHLKFSATPEEIKTWEHYNGKGSFNSGKIVDVNSEAIKVKDEKTVKSIFRYDTERKEEIKSTEDFPY